MPEDIYQFQRSVREIRTRISDAPVNRDTMPLLSEVDTFLMSSSGEIYLYGFDNFVNLGDQALWLSLCRLLRELNKNIVIKGLLPTNPSPATLREKKIVLIFPGGGSLGNRYYSSLRRVKLIESLNPIGILQMPLSTTFSATGPQTEERVATAYAAPESTLIFTRDLKSQGEAKSQLGLETKLVRDLTAILPDLSDLRVGGKGILLLFRNDQEASSREELQNKTTLQTVDWEDITAKFTYEYRLLNRLWRRLNSDLRPRLTTTQIPCRIRFAVANRIAEIQTARALAFISGFDAVVTDRLHGVLLSRKFGLRVAAVENDHGKLSRYLQTWESDAIDKGDIVLYEKAEQAVAEFCQASV